MEEVAYEAQRKGYYLHISDDIKQRWDSFPEYTGLDIPRECF